MEQTLRVDYKEATDELGEALRCMCGKQACRLDVFDDKQNVIGAVNVCYNYAHLMKARSDGNEAASPLPCCFLHQHIGSKPTCTLGDAWSCYDRPADTNPNILELPGIQCDCSLPCVCLRTKQGKNVNRYFFGCPERKCKSFRWFENARVREAIDMAVLDKTCTMFSEQTSDAPPPKRLKLPDNLERFETIMKELTALWSSSTAKARTLIASRLNDFTAHNDTISDQKQGVCVADTISSSTISSCDL